MTATQRLAFGIGLFIGIAIGVPSGAAIGSAGASPLPVCAQEDGNTDGLPCAWTDPGSGRQFYVDSANYR